MLLHHGAITNPLLQTVVIVVLLIGYHQLPNANPSSNVFTLQLSLSTKALGVITFYILE